MNKKIEIAYIDDDEDVIFGSLLDIENEISKITDAGFDIHVSFFKIKDEQSQEEFWERLEKNNYHGIIMDYRLVDSGIFDNASVMWKKIKSHNPLFPLAIYTSNHDEVTINSDAESIFDKGNSEQINKMLNYLIRQIRHNYNTIEALQRVNNELKKDQGISYAVLKNEEDIENQFSLFFESGFSKDDEEKFKELINNAFDIIDKYSERKDEI